MGSAESIGSWSESEALEWQESNAAAFPIVELRQYKLHDGRRDTLIELFERAFIEPQEALGMKVIGTFRDLDRPDRFVWLRGFRDMDSRVAGLTDFYDGSVWKAHREAANATMIDSDNVLLLRALDGAAAFKPSPARPSRGEDRPAGLILATICHLQGSPETAAAVFRSHVVRRLERASVPVLAWFVSETGPNNYPRLPVREGEHVLVWFTRLARDAGRAAYEPAFADAADTLRPLLKQPCELLRLDPTERSQLR